LKALIMTIAKNLRAVVLLTSNALLLVGVFAQTGMNHSQMGNKPMTMPSATAGRAAMSDGEVKKVDLKAQTITLKHGPLINLDMPGMTMSFRVKTPALLDKLKAGDQVKFVAEMTRGVMTVSAIELAK
jgi:Cu(I)/Ag(I) efflux system protein CusF